MTREEFIKFASAINSYYPRDNFLPTDESKELWYMALKDIPSQQAIQGLMEYIKSNKFAPTIADIRASVYDSQVDDDGWSKSWEEAMRAVRSFGYMNEQDALTSLDKTTREVVRRYGYKDLCMTEQDNIPTVKAQFRMVYEQVTSKARSAAVKSDNMIDEINKAKIDCTVTELLEGMQNV